MDRADEVRRILSGLRFSREWEPKLVLQVLDATSDMRVRLRVFFQLAQFGCREAEEAFLDLLRSRPGEWLADLKDMEPAERLIATLLTLKMTGAPPPKEAERTALLDLLSKIEEVQRRRIERVVEEEIQLGREYSAVELECRLDNQPLPQILNLWLE